MLQIDFSFLNVEGISEFTSTFLDICSTTSYPFEFPLRSKRPTIDILKFIAITLSNQDKKFALIRVDEYGELKRYYELINTCQNMNIIFQYTGGDASYLNGKSLSPN